MEEGKTSRGFAYIPFTDLYGSPCSLQKSSLASDDAIWFGVDDPAPKIMASRTLEGGTGWVPYPIPDHVSINSRMHLSRDQVKELLPHLKKFVKSGNI